jgi:hypothetical protein
LIADHYEARVLKNNFCLDFVGECIDIKNATDNKVDAAITKLLVLLVGVSGLRYVKRYSGEITSERAQYNRKDARDDLRPRCDPHLSSSGACEKSDLVHRLFGIIEHRDDPLKQRPAVEIGFDAACGAIEQRHAEGSLQRRDGL